MALAHDGALFLLAFDQRDGLAETIGTTAEEDRLVEVKRVLRDAAVAVHDRGLPAGDRLGVVVDERYGSEVARAATGQGLTLAMPAHRDDVDELTLAYGDDFGAHVDAFDPSIVTVALGWNPGQPPEVKKLQARRLTSLAAWLHEVGRRLLVDLHAPPTDHDLDVIDGDVGRFRHEVRPELLCRGVQELRDLGIEPDLWQLPLGAGGAAEDDLLTLVHDEGRDHVVALAGDRDGGDLEARARVAGATSAIGGVVVGPNLWAAPISELVAGRGTRGDAVAAVRDALTLCIDTYTAARAA